MLAVMLDDELAGVDVLVNEDFGGLVKFTMNINNLGRSLPNFPVVCYIFICSGCDLPKAPALTRHDDENKQ